MPAKILHDSVIFCKMYRKLQITFEFLVDFKTFTQVDLVIACLHSHMYYFYIKQCLYQVEPSRLLKLLNMYLTFNYFFS